MQIALVTCRDLPGWEVDDAPFHRALGALDAEFELVAWDDPEADWSRFRGALLRTTWDYTERVDEFVAWAKRSAERTHLLHGARVVAWNAHKSYLRDLRELGIPVTDSAFLEARTEIDLDELCRERGWDRVFLKPMVGATARETLPVDSDPESRGLGRRHLDRMLENEGMIVQPFLESVRTEGELSIVFIDGEATHGVRKVPVAGDYRVQDDFGAHDERWDFGPADLELAQRTLERSAECLGSDVEPLLYARVDFLRDPAGDLRINEVELIEPSLFFRHGPEAATRLARAFIDRL